MLLRPDLCKVQQHRFGDMYQTDADTHAEVHHLLIQAVRRRKSAVLHRISDLVILLYPVRRRSNPTLLVQNHQYDTDIRTPGMRT